ncbi:patatin-like phospholipase family protein [Jannaschia sp. Os4]|uniref:patatin-like phospholipase family protein n=1 Tax=Jannaschia sp. Os4 TaxID=2807617 RepID=UPI00193A9928|nr:patatin-like phospholipase family protein [Jannaschia sp. Os4]MBM2575215.1 patatin-like phospholipase family protein [Jannaschia sp. Os4]
MRRIVPLLLLALSACALDRPEGLSCPSLPVDAPAPVLSSQSEGGDVLEATTNSMIAAIEAEAPAARAIPTPQVRRAPAAPPITLRIVTLSAGGQYGAFGAGVLRGWSEAPGGRPTFDVVTGVSAGAILAPIAFAGPEFDGALDFYRGLDADRVSRGRFLPALLRAPSLRDASPLRAFLARALSPALVSAIAARHAQGDRLLVAATNLDTTAGEVFDLGAGTADGAPCLAAAMQASAAIPGVLPPVAIDGALYADGGLREQVFFQAIDTARARIARETGREVRVEAFLVVNGALVPPQAPVEDRLLSYIGRAVETLADEVLRDSILDAVRFAEGRPGWTLRGLAAQDVDLSPCLAPGEGTPTGTFDPCVTRVLFDHGRGIGRGLPNGFLSAADLRRLAAEL